MPNLKGNRSALFGGIGIAIIVLGVFALRTYGQFEHSGFTSPPAKVEATVAGKKITIDYYAPSMHGRKVMGGLVPFGEVWCTGANWATKITTEAPLQMGNLKLAAGSYSIWTIPNSHEWTLIINKQTGQFHKDYDPSTDLGRTRMNLKSLPAPVETFKINLRDDGGKQGTLALDWDTTEASIPFTVLP
jgi:hypothetical protein